MEILDDIIVIVMCVVDRLLEKLEWVCGKNEFVEFVEEF